MSSVIGILRISRRGVCPSTATVEFHPPDSYAIGGWPDAPIAVAVTPLEKPYGKSAKALYRGSFLLRPEVWRAAGSDDEFLEWVRRQPSAISGAWSVWDDQLGIGGCEPMHVRRQGSGAGVAKKPEYAAIPGTHDEHMQQHSQGEASLMPREKWDKARIAYVRRWVHEVICRDCGGFKSLADIPPALVIQWAEKRDVARYLPDEYSHTESG